MANVTTKEVKKLLKEGKNVSEIASKFGITRQAVYHHINKLKGKKKRESDFSKPKKNYNSLIDWKIYNEGLVRRREVLFELELFDDWDEELFFLNRDKSGRPYKFPDSFIWFLCRLKSIFKIDYRTLEGISRKCRLSNTY